MVRIFVEFSFFQPDGRLLADSSRDSLLLDFDCTDDTRMPAQTIHSIPAFFHLEVVLERGAVLEAGDDVSLHGKLID